MLVFVEPGWNDSEDSCQSRPAKELMPPRDGQNAGDGYNGVGRVASKLMESLATSSQIQRDIPEQAKR